EQFARRRKCRRQACEHARQQAATIVKLRIRVEPVFQQPAERSRVVVLGELDKQLRALCHRVFAQTRGEIFNDGPVGKPQCIEQVRGRGLIGCVRRRDERLTDAGRQGVVGIEYGDEIPTPGGRGKVRGTAAFWRGERARCAKRKQALQRALVSLS